MSEQKEKYINPLTDFKEAEIAKFTPEERAAYEESLKHYRDINNVMNTAREEGRKEIIQEIAKKLKKNGVSIDIIMKSTGGLGIVGGPITFFLYIFGVFFILSYPITKERYAEIRRGLR